MRGQTTLLIIIHSFRKKERPNDLVYTLCLDPKMFSYVGAPSLPASKAACFLPTTFLPHPLSRVLLDTVHLAIHEQPGHRDSQPADRADLTRSKTPWLKQKPDKSTTI